MGEEGVIIRGMWIQPKLYCFENLDKNKDGEYKLKLHVRAKGISLVQTPLNLDDFVKLVAQEKILAEQWQFKRVKEDLEFGIETRYLQKSIGGLWSGRRLEGNNWIPHGSTAP